MVGVDSIAPATLRHAAAVALRLRAGSVRTMRFAAESPLRAICHAVRETCAPLAWVRDGKAIAMGGVAGAPIGLEGIAWVALTEEAERHHRALVRLFLPILATEKQTRPRLATVIDPIDGAALRFVEWCGFRVDGEAERPGFVRYVWERE